ncbi:MAG: nicotinamide-nucleotide amidohydrolase family protein [Actinomycetota bacterium]|nr:nicotinamide-nucleotide amidohydrolase family protein [Actinomycetota bacterium]
MPSKPTAAILTIGTELVTGQRLDTNSTEIALALHAAGFTVTEMLSLGDDVAACARQLERLCAACELVIVTGGLGPTHDDITREGASHALKRPLLRDQSIAEGLLTVIARHRDPKAAEHILLQADILEDATVIPATTGTAPGQAAATPRGTLLLLPGPPHEMRPMLAAFLGEHHTGVPPVRLRCTGTTESDVQLAAQRALAGHRGVELTVLAAPAEVEVVLFDEGAGEEGLLAAGLAVEAALGDVCYSNDGASLAEVVVRRACAAGVRLACAESCTGGLIASALTDVAGASDVFTGGVVAYSNDLKIAALDVPPGLLAQFGAVSGETAAAMAEGIAALTGATYAVATTGIAGPGGGSYEKPVGLVWFGLVTPKGTSTSCRSFPGDRAGVRIRATRTALDLVRRALPEAQ